MYVDCSGEFAIVIAALLFIGVGALVLLTSCNNSDATDSYDYGAFSSLSDGIGMVENFVKFEKDSTRYKFYIDSYCRAVSQYYNGDGLYWDNYLDEVFSGNKEKCIESIQADSFYFTTTYDETYISDIDYLIRNFKDWAFVGRTYIFNVASRKTIQSGIDLYQDNLNTMWGVAN